MPSSPCSLILAMALVALPAGAATSSPSSSAVQTPAKAPAKKRTPAPPTRRGARPAPAAKAAPVKDATADCDTPAATGKGAAPKPIPVAANPLAATLAPCTDPTPKS